MPWPLAASFFTHAFHPARDAGRLLALPALPRLRTSRPARGMGHGRLCAEPLGLAHQFISPSRRILGHLLALGPAHRPARLHDSRNAPPSLRRSGLWLAVLCKYSGAFLGIGLALCVLYTSPSDRRISALGIFSAAALLVASPLVYAQLETGFYLPQTLSTLSRIEALTNPFTRLIFFAVNPLLFISPVLLYLLQSTTICAGPT